MEDYDFNVSNYSVRDMEALLQIEDHDVRDPTLIQAHANNVLQQIRQSPGTTPAFQAQFEVFLDNLVDRLLLRHRHNVTRPRPDIHTVQPIVPVTDKPFLYTAPSDFFTSPHGMNPLDKHLQTCVVCIDSIFRDNYYSTSSNDFMYSFPQSLNRVVSMQLRTLEIPRMWYEFSPQTTSFTLSLYNMKLEPTLEPQTFYSQTIQLYLPASNHTSDSFVSLMTALFSSIAQTSNGACMNFIKYDIDTNRSKSIFRATNVSIDMTLGVLAENIYDPYNLSGKYYSPDFYFVVDFTPLPPLPPSSPFLLGGQYTVGPRTPSPTKTELPSNLSLAYPHKSNHTRSLGSLIGFLKQTYVVTKTQSVTYYNLNNLSTGVTFSGIVESESSFGRTITPYIYLDVNDYNNNKQSHLYYASNGPDNTMISNDILARISMTNVSYTIITDSSLDAINKTREYYGPVRLEKLRIRLLDRFGALVDINNNDFSFALEIKQLYS